MQRSTCLSLVLAALAGCAPAGWSDGSDDGVGGKADGQTIDPFDPASCPGQTLSGTRFDELTQGGTVPLPQATVYTRLRDASEPTQGRTIEQAQVTYDVQPQQFHVEVAYIPKGRTDRYVWALVILPDEPWSIVEWEAGYHDASAASGDETHLNGASMVVNEHCLRTTGQITGADGRIRELVAIARF
jgi:hypothetical protein